MSYMACNLNQHIRCEIYCVCKHIAKKLFYKHFHTSYQNVVVVVIVTQAVTNKLFVKLMEVVKTSSDLNKIIMLILTIINLVEHYIPEFNNCSISKKCEILTWLNTTFSNLIIAANQRNVIF